MSRWGTTTPSTTLFPDGAPPRPGKTGHAEVLLFRNRDGADEVHPVLFRFGTAFGERGLIAGAREYFALLHQISSALFGPDDARTVEARRHIERWQDGPVGPDRGDQ